jgi:geranylgeranyl pyrophosphate synthase
MTADKLDMFRERIRLVDDALGARLPSAATAPEKVHEAMRYAVLSGGKRLRPVALLAAAAALGRRPEAFFEAACAVELAHTASLILDDLPCMDNAALRRGRPCTHKEYGESTAILAAIALLSESFRLVARNACTLGNPENAAAAVALLDDALGPRGLVGGQELDLQLTGKDASLETVMRVHAQKAGALFVAAVRLPAVLAGADDDTGERLARFAAPVGLAFQITDDLIDTADPSEDAGKCTFVRLLGAEGAQSRVADLIDEAISAISPFGEGAEGLRQLASYVRNRQV